MSVSMGRVENFNTIPPEEAKKIIYEELLVHCFVNNVELSSLGNHKGVNSGCSANSYTDLRKAHNLFNVEHVQQVYAAVAKLNIATGARRQVTSASEIAQVLETQFAADDKENNLFTVGNVTAAMLLHGYEGNFVVRNQPRVSCEFKVQIKV